MTHRQPRQPEGREAIIEITDGAVFGKALGDALAGALTHARRGPWVEHTSHRLSEPTQVGVFGTFSEELKPTKYGTAILGELDGGAGAVAWTEADAEGKRFQVVIGPTPKNLDPRKGGRIRGVEGEPADFLVWHQGLGEDGHAAYRFLTRSDLESVVLTAGRETKRLEDVAGLRGLSLGGKVEQALAYRGNV